MQALGEARPMCRCLRLASLGFEPSFSCWCCLCSWFAGSRWTCAWKWMKFSASLCKKVARSHDNIKPFGILEVCREFSHLATFTFFVKFPSEELEAEI